MNCKPDQLAWIKVPKEYARFGVEQLHNRVVRVEASAWGPMPSWHIEPTQVVLLSGPIRDGCGTVGKAGETFEVRTLPDAWLVPLRGTPEVTRRGAVPVVEQTL